MSWLGGGDCVGLLLYQLLGVAILLPEPGQVFVPLHSGSRCWGDILAPVVQGSDYGYLVGYGVMEIEVSVSVRGLSEYIVGEGPVRVLNNEYI